MSGNVAAQHRRLVAAIRKHGKRGGDPKLQHYVGSPHPVLGLSVPQMRAILAAFRKDHRGLTAGQLNALAAKLWKGPSFEEKAMAVFLLGAYSKITDEETWRLVDRWAGESVGWGMCDGLGSGPVARMAHEDPAKFRALLRWAKSPNLWRRRVAVYGLREYVLAKEMDRPFELLERVLYDEEFWVQRAVGTWLRNCWVRDRTRTEAFLRKHAKGLPKIAITVATERAPKAFREELRRVR